jgi:hypothetical protein
MTIRLVKLTAADGGAIWVNAARVAWRAPAPTEGPGAVHTFVVFDQSLSTYVAHPPEHVAGWLRLGAS